MEAAYNLAMAELLAAVEELKTSATRSTAEFEVAYERARIAQKSCEAARVALFSRGASQLSPH